MFIWISCRFIDTLKDDERSVLYIDDYFVLQLLCGLSTFVVFGMKAIFIVLLVDLRSYLYLFKDTF